jgi:tetratricopeptide (TPR) repeat protein
MRARVAVSRALRRRDRLEDAIEELEQALEEANHSPLDAGQLIPAYSSLAWAHIDAEHYDRALTYLERALVLAEEEGPGPNTALILAAKGRALDGLDRAEAATEAFDEAIGMLDAALGETNPNSLWVRELRAAARVRIEPEISRRELERVVAAFETQLGEDEPLLIDAYRDLADAELHCDDRTAARKHLERSLEVMRGVHPEGHPELVARQKQIDALKRGGA